MIRSRPASSTTRAHSSSSTSRRRHWRNAGRQSASRLPPSHAELRVDGSFRRGRVSTSRARCRPGPAMYSERRAAKGAGALGGFFVGTIRSAHTRIGRTARSTSVESRISGRLVFSPLLTQPRRFGCPRPPEVAGGSITVSTKARGVTRSRPTSRRPAGGHSPPGRGCHPRPFPRIRRACAARSRQTLGYPRRRHRTARWMQGMPTQSCSPRSSTFHITARTAAGVAAERARDAV